MKKFVFLLCIIVLFNGCGEDKNNNSTGNLNQEKVEVEVEVKQSVEELSDEIFDIIKSGNIDSAKILELKSLGGIIPEEMLVQEVQQELSKRGNPSEEENIDSKKIIEISKLNIIIPNLDELYKTELNDAKPDIYKLATYLLFGADINYVNSKGKKIIDISNSDGKTALMYAAQHNYLGVMENLIKVGADVNKANKTGGVAIMYASQHSNLLVIQELIKAGADINRVDIEGDSPLIIASFNDDLLIIQELIKAGADVNRFSIKGDSPLIHASFSNSLLLVQELIRNGADPNKSGKEGWTPLIVASQEGHIEVIRELIINKADINKVNSSGMTPLISAASHGRPTAIEELIKSGAEIDKVNNSGWTALMYASQEDNLEVIKILLKNGASVTKKNKSGLTAKNIAKSNNQKNVLEMLNGTVFIYDGSGDKKVATSKYFEATIHNIKLLKKVDTGNRYTSLAEQDGVNYLIIDLTFKNIDNESRVVFDGNLYIKQGEDILKYDKSEVITSKGYGVFFDSINPRMWIRTKLVYKLPSDMTGELFYEPYSGTEPISIGNLPGKDN